MRKLSKSITDLKPFYDVVIIGSGYGGSIAASRFSRAGLKVCLLEKGKEFQPGEYPVTLMEAECEMQLNTFICTCISWIRIIAPQPARKIIIEPCPQSF